MGWAGGVRSDSEWDGLEGGGMTVSGLEGGGVTVGMAPLIWTHWDRLKCPH